MSVKGTIHHIEINVRDLKKTTDFWKWLLLDLGYEVHQEWSSGISFILDKTYIVFVQTEERFLENEYHRKNIGLNHVAFHGGSKQKIDNIAKQLKEKGVNLLYEEKFPHAGGENHYAVYFEDPNRIKIEIAV